MPGEKIVAFGGEKRERGWIEEVSLEALAESNRHNNPSDRLTPEEISVVVDRMQAAYTKWIGEDGQANLGKAIAERLGLEILILRGKV